MKNNSKEPRSMGQDENGEMYYTNSPSWIYVVVIAVLAIIIALV